LCGGGGALIFEDISSVLAKFNNTDSVLLHTVDDASMTGSITMTAMSLNTIGITDTTGKMGKLGEYLQENGREHAYCFAHLIHLVHRNAFDRKSAVSSLFVICLMYW
jgi:hypothetical protein